MNGSETGGFVPVSAEVTLQPLDRLDLEEGKPEPRWQIAWFAFAAVFALTGATALILPHVAPVFGARSAAPADQAGSRPVGVVCIPDTLDRGYCSRYVKDVARRTPITGSPSALSSAKAIDVAMLGVRPSPGQAYVDAVRGALAAYPGAVVRAARPDDPAPVGTVIFAVPVGADCVLGFLRAGSNGVGVGPGVVGHLPDGTCLVL